MFVGGTDCLCFWCSWNLLLLLTDVFLIDQVQTFDGQITVVAYCSGVVVYVLIITYIIAICCAVAVWYTSHWVSAEYWLQCFDDFHCEDNGSLAYNCPARPLCIGPRHIYLMFASQLNNGCADNVKILHYLLACDCNCCAIQRWRRSVISTIVDTIFPFALRPVTGRPISSSAGCSESSCSMY